MTPKPEPTAPPLWHMFRIDHRSLAAFRVAIALVMFWDLAVRATDLVAHYTDAGVLPRHVLRDLVLTSRPYFSIHTLGGSARFEAALFGVAALCALALLAGFQTRAASVACWFLTCSLHTRNPLILHGGDDLLRLLLFWALFVPLGAAWSVDARRRPRPSPVVYGSTCSWGTAGLLLQLCYVYLFSAALKSHPVWRHDGTAVYLALSIDQFTTPIGRAILPYHGLLKLLTFGTLAMELGGPFLALFSYESARLRSIVAIAFMAFHIALGLCIELGIFPAVCIAGWFLFLPGSFWSAVAERLRSAHGARRPSEQWATGSGESASEAPVVATVPSDRCDGYDQPTQPEAAAAKSTGTTRTAPGHAAAVRAPKPIPAAAHPGGTGLARRRLALGGEIIAAFALVYITLWNVRAGNYERVSRIFPVQLNAIGEAARIDQYWCLFAPRPTLEHGWYVLDARLADGAEMDLRTGGPVSWRKPALVSATYRNERWRKYLMNLSTTEYTEYRRYYADYLRRAWDAAHRPEDRLSRLDIVFVQETALPNYRVSPAERIVLWTARWP